MKQHNNQPVEMWKTNNLLSGSALEQGGGRKGKVRLLLLIFWLILGRSNRGDVEKTNNLLSGPALAQGWEWKGEVSLLLFMLPLILWRCDNGNRKRGGDGASKAAAVRTTNKAKMQSTYPVWWDSAEEDKDDVILLLVILWCSNRHNTNERALEARRPRQRSWP